MTRERSLSPFLRSQRDTLLHDENVALIAYVNYGAGRFSREAPEAPNPSPWLPRTQAIGLAFQPTFGGNSARLGEPSLARGTQSGKVERATGDGSLNQVTNVALQWALEEPT
jgi:hypothetical protein